MYICEIVAVQDIRVTVCQPKFSVELGSMGVHACTKCSKTLNHLSTFKNGQTLMKYTLQKQNFSQSA